ncbi:hypothetical protein [uncultured Tateyamaria sp.]|uniref:hypothetical protein n=1 Tax=uncultured Tateyamaria sp. TaxID=455651 RepID=UPI0026380FF1|nr:hypothetical protein [uncultured Tateyamaria sp.]
MAPDTAKTQGHPVTLRIIIATALCAGLAACDGPIGYQVGEGAGSPVPDRAVAQIERGTASPSARTLSRNNPDYRQWANDRR